MDVLSDVERRRRRTYSILTGIIVLTVPCYCAGFLALMFAPPPATDATASACHRHPCGNRHPRRDTDPSAALTGERHHPAFDSDSIHPGHKNVHAVADIYVDRIVHAQPDSNLYADSHTHLDHNGGGYEHAHFHRHV